MQENRCEMYDALAPIAVAWVTFHHPATALKVSDWCFTIGMRIFSFSLYIMALTDQRWLGAVTPIGGTTMLAGWVLLGCAALPAPR